MFRMRAGLLAGLFAFLVLPVTSVQAATPVTQPRSESILLSPTSKRYEVKAGTERRDSFTIINDGDTAFDFVTYTRPYSVSDEAYTADFINNAKNADAYKWVQFEQPSYRVEVDQSIEVKYTLRVPSDATPGGHYGVLFAETLPDAQANGTGVKTKKRVGAILYVTVDGDVTRSGKLLSTDVPFLQFNAPLSATQRIKNQGNTDFDVKTSVVVSDIFGGTKYKNDRSLAVLPSTVTVRAIKSDWQSPAWIGLYKVELTTSFLDTKSSSTHYVLLIPIWVYLTLGLLIAGRIVYATKLRKKR